MLEAALRRNTNLLTWRIYTDRKMFRKEAVVYANAARRHLATHAPSTSTADKAFPAIRHDWRKVEIQQIYDTPLLDLVFRAASVHRQHHDPSKVQLCTLMNIKSEY